MAPKPELDVVGLGEIAVMFDVERKTPNTWQARNMLPKPDKVVGKVMPLWWRETILAWARENGRDVVNEHPVITEPRKPNKPAS